MKASLTVSRVLCLQVYKKTYSWAHNSNDANWAAYITIAKAPGSRQSEEDMERGVGSRYDSSRPVIPPPPSVVSHAKLNTHSALRYHVTSLHERGTSNCLCGYCMILVQLCCCNMCNVYNDARS